MNPEALWGQSPASPERLEVSTADLLAEMRALGQRLASIEATLAERPNREPPAA